MGYPKKQSQIRSGRQEFSKFLSILFMGMKQELLQTLAEKERANSPRVHQAQVKRSTRRSQLGFSHVY